MAQGGCGLSTPPAAVAEALNELLQDVTCLVQAHAISAKEINKALKLLLKQFAADTALLHGFQGPCEGLPTPYQLVRWLLDQMGSVNAMLGTGSRLQHHSSKQRQARPLLQHLAENSQQQQKEQDSSALGALRTGAAASVTTGVLLPHAAGDRSAQYTGSSSSKHTSTGSRPPLRPICNMLRATTSAAPPASIAALAHTPQPAVPTAATHKGPKRRTRMKQQRQASSNRTALACKLQSRAADCYLAAVALEECSSLVASKAPHPCRLSPPPTTATAAADDPIATAGQANHPNPRVEKPPSPSPPPQQLLSSSYLELCQELGDSQDAAAPLTAADTGAALTSTAPAKHMTRANPSSPCGSVTKPADAVTAANPTSSVLVAPPGADAGKIGQGVSLLLQQQQQQLRAMPNVLAIVHIKRSLLLPSTSVNSSITHHPPTAAGTPDAASCAADDTLKKLIALKQLTQASFQAELRSKITAEAPGKQYCHVSLPDAPAGGVCSLAGHSSSSGGSSGAGCSSEFVAQSCGDCDDSSGEAVPDMAVLFRDAEKVKCQAASKQHERGTAHKQHNKAMLEQHKLEAAEHQRRREEAAAARLSALKSASLPEYLDMLKQAKNGRLQQVLEQTDDCLRQLAAKLGVQGLLDAAASPGGAAEPDVGAAACSSGNSSDKAGILGSSSAWASLAAQLHADIQQQPALLKGGQLREYQMQGVRWLVGLSDKGLNGILADDMGLGKTVQVIAMICHCVEVQQSPGSFLIVCPASVISNWAAELSRWAPDLTVVQYKGTAEVRESVYLKQVRKRSFNVLLTTYELLMAPADRARLSRIKWQGIVVDEGHRLKNSDCKLAQELRAYISRNRLLLTGTPLQNKLSELWSLLNFLMPDVFNSADDFDSWFGAPLQAIKDAQSGCAADVAGSAAEASLLSQEEYLLVTNRLHQVLRPFMLRRLKEAVATELPGKSEVVLQCQLSPYQAVLYDLVKSKLRNEAAAGTAGSSSNSGSAAAGVKGVNNTVMELRNICNHPLLSKLHPEYGEDLLKDPCSSSSSSGALGGRLPAVLRLSCKVDLLDQVLVRLHAAGHKVLLFCTMTRLLDVLEEYLEWRGFTHLRLDGGTGAQDRADAVNRFNDPSSGVFLFMLSLRAGGVGLNLQAADTVIMYDSDWNPQIDLQAQARAHRIGQARQVLVIRLVAQHTIEEHILAVAEQKRKFADSSITGGFFDGQTSAEARRQYLLQILDTNPAAAASGAGAAKAAAGITAGRLNKLLARNEQELQLWQARDTKLFAQQQQQVVNPNTVTADNSATAAAAAAGGCAPDAVGNQLISRLATEEESADLIAAAREAAAPRPEEDLSSYGRGMRGANSADAAEQSAAAAAAKRQQRAATAMAGALAAAAAVAVAAPKEKRPPGRLRKQDTPAAATVRKAAAAMKAVAAVSSAAAETDTDVGTAETAVTDSVAAGEQGALASTAESPPPTAGTKRAAIVSPAAEDVVAPAAAAAAAGTSKSSDIALAAACSKALATAGVGTGTLTTDQPQEQPQEQQEQPLERALVGEGADVPESLATGAVATAADKLQAAANSVVKAVSDPPVGGSAAAAAIAASFAGTLMQPAVNNRSLQSAAGAERAVRASAAAVAEVARHPPAVQQTGTGRRPGRSSKADAAAKLALEAAAAFGGSSISISRDDSSRRCNSNSKRAAVHEARVDVDDAAVTPAVGDPSRKKQRTEAAAVAKVLLAATATVESHRGRGVATAGSSSSKLSEMVAVCYGSAQGWYSIVRGEVLLSENVQQQQHNKRHTRGSSSNASQQLGELWLSKSAFMKLGGESHQQDADKAIKLLLPNGQKGSSIGTYIEQWKQQQQQKEQMIRQPAAAAAAGGELAGSSRARRYTNQETEAPLHVATDAQAGTTAAAGNAVNSRMSLAVAAGVPGTDISEAAGAAAAVAHVKKRGRPSKAATAAKLAAEAEAAFGGNLNRSSIAGALRGAGVRTAGGLGPADSSRGKKRGTAASSLIPRDGDVAGETTPVLNSKRSKPCPAVAKEAATAGEAGEEVCVGVTDTFHLVADAAAAFDVMCGMQRAVTMPEESGPTDAAAVGAGWVVMSLGQVFDSLWW